MANVMVAGAGGYIGTLLVEELLKSGHKVLGVDRYYFGKDLLAAEILNDQAFKLIQKDINDLEPNDFKDVDVVMDLAGLSNDPSCDLRPKLTYKINFQGGCHIADVAKTAGVSRYIYSSSCSVYGHGEARSLTEESSPNPVSSYAKGKVDVEKHLLALSDAKFSVTILRNATAFGLSKRMRFDLAINVMTLHAWRDRKIYIMGGGQQWRPLVHIKDIAHAFLLAMNVKKDKINGEIFNVGTNEQNYQVFQIANFVKEVIPQTEIIRIPDDPDKRTYNVNFDKIKKALDFQVTTTVQEGIREVNQALNYGILDPEDIRCYTIKYYKYLMDVEKTIGEVAIRGRIF